MLSYSRLAKEFDSHPNKHQLPLYHVADIPAAWCCIHIQVQSVQFFLFPKIFFFCFHCAVEGKKICDVRINGMVFYLLFVTFLFCFPLRSISRLNLHKQVYKAYFAFIYYFCKWTMYCTIFFFGIVFWFLISLYIVLCSYKLLFIVG